MKLESQLLSVREVAGMLGLGISTIWRQVRQGNLPRPVRIGGSTRWRRADIEALIARASEKF